ncbi:MAG: hypothetical protein V5A51_09240 [Bacteroidales bacterium]
MVWNKYTAEAKKSAIAGVGKPIKCAFCRVSILNFASLNPAKILNIKGRKMRIPKFQLSDESGWDPKEDENINKTLIKTKNAGATPKLTISARESS